MIIDRTHVLILETPRLQLRTFVSEDIDALARVLSDPETMRHYPAPFEVLRSTGELIGDCGLIRQDVDNRDEVEIGYHTRRDLWGHGLATEAARACRDYGFQTLPVQRLISLIRPGNLPSRRVAEKNGMRLTKEVVWKHIPRLLYAIEREGCKRRQA